MHMSAIPIVHLFAGLAIYRYFEPNALAAVIGIEWLSARVAALHAIGPHHAAFFLAIFPTLLFSLVYFTPAQRAKIIAQGPPQNPGGYETHAMPPIPVNTTGLTAFGMVLCFVFQFGGEIDTSYSHWWGMAVPGVFLNTWGGRWVWSD